MRVTVMNPPKGLTRPRLYKRGRKYFRGKKSSLPERMRLSNPRRKRRRLSRKARASAIRNLLKARRARVRRVSKRHFRRRRLHNPFQGTLMTLNPGKNLKRRHHRRKTVMAKRKRKHYRRHSNPAISGLKGLIAVPREMVSTSFVMEAAGVAAGFMLPTMVMNQIPATWRAAKWQGYAWKVGAIAALTVGAGFVNKRIARFVMVGGGVSLLLDLYAEFMGGGMSAPALPAPNGTKIYTGVGPGGMRLFTGNPGMPGAEGVVNGLGADLFEV